MATSFGPLLSALRQRAASHSSAVESGPPETASTSTGNCSRPEKSCLASDCETDDASAVATLLFLGDVALHLRRGLRIFASDLGERGAGRLLLMQRRATGRGAEAPLAPCRSARISSTPPGRIPPPHDNAAAGTGSRRASIGRWARACRSGTWP